jgi:hypothetical protein
MVAARATASTKGRVFVGRLSAQRRLALVHRWAFARGGTSCTLIRRHLACRAGGIAGETEPARRTRRSSRARPRLLHGRERHGRTRRRARRARDVCARHACSCINGCTGTDTDAVGDPSAQRMRLAVKVHGLSPGGVPPSSACGRPGPGPTPRRPALSRRRHFWQAWIGVAASLRKDKRREPRVRARRLLRKIGIATLSAAPRSLHGGAAGCARHQSRPCGVSPSGLLAGEHRTDMG